MKRSIDARDLPMERRNMFYINLSRSFFKHNGAPNLSQCTGNYCHIKQYEVGTLAVDGVQLHLVQRRGNWAGPQPAQAVPSCTKCNSLPTASVPITVLLYNGSLLCGFNKPFKGLTETCSS